MKMFSRLFSFKKNAKQSRYYLSARGVGDLKGFSEAVEFDTEMRRKQGVIWQNIVHQSMPKHV